jgi:hypothetical protein
VRDGVSPENCADAYNSEANSVFVDASQAIINQTGFPVDQVRTQNGEVQVVAERGAAVERPDFRILVDTDWIGFDIPVAAPVIMQPAAVSVVGNGQTEVVIEVRNGADVGGEIQLTSTCEAPVSGGSDTQVVAAGEIADFVIPVSAGPSEDTTATCELTAQDTDDASTAYTETLTVNVEASCPDTDGDGVCDQFDACPDTVGPNNGCPITDDDDETETGGGLLAGAAEFLRETFGGVGEPVADGLDGVNQFIDELSTDLSNFVANPFGRVGLAMDLAVTGLAALVAFAAAQSRYLAPVTDAVATYLPVSEKQFRLWLGLGAAALAAYIAYGLFSQLWVKIALVVLLVVGTAGYVYVQSLVPG